MGDKYRVMEHRGITDYDDYYRPARGDGHTTRLIGQIVETVDNQNDLHIFGPRPAVRVGVPWGSLEIPLDVLEGPLAQWEIELLADPDGWRDIEESAAEYEDSPAEDEEEDEYEGFEVGQEVISTDRTIQGDRQTRPGVRGTITSTDRAPLIHIDWEDGTSTAVFEKRVDLVPDPPHRFKVGDRVDWINKNGNSMGSWQDVEIIELIDTPGYLGYRVNSNPADFPRGGGGPGLLREDEVRLHESDPVGVVGGEPALTFTEYHPYKDEVQDSGLWSTLEAAGVIPNPAPNKFFISYADDVKNPEAVDHPAHYGGEDDPYEVIKVIEAWGLDYHLGNALKYIRRAGVKNPETEAEDLRKGAWHLNRKADNLEAN